MEMSPEMETAYRRVFSALRAERDATGSADFSAHASVIRQTLERLQSQDSAVYSFIPSTRSFFITPQKAVIATSNRSDQLTLRFSQDFSFDYLQRIPKVGLDHELVRWIDAESRVILKGEVELRGALEVFRTDDGRDVALPFLSSGSQELLPLITRIREFVAISCAISKALVLSQALHRRLFFVEEPETSIFPSTQYELVRVFARMAKEPVLDASWVITTHSPYILSAFGNLIKAGQVAREHHERVEALKKVTPEQYWIDPTNFKAFALKPSKASPGQFESESIVDKETGEIDGDYLDDVSSGIAEEFGQLLELQYGK